MRKIIAGVTLAAAACGSDPSPPQPIDIGFLAPLTGDIAAFGRELTDASNLALEEINSAGGVLGGREMRLVVNDTGTSASGAQISYTALLNQQMPVILGPATSSEAVAIREQVRAGTTLTISQSATSPELGTLDYAGYFFRLAPSDAIQAIVLADLIADANLAGLCVVHRDDSYGKALAAAVDAGITTPITIAKFDPALADLTAVLDPCETLKATPNTGILFITLVADGAQLIDDAASRGWTPSQHQVFLTDGTKNRDLVSVLGSPGFVEGAIGTAPTGPDPDGPDGLVLRDFRARFKSRFSRDADVYAEMAYDAMYVAAMTIHLAGDIDDRTAIRDQIGSIATGAATPPGDWAALRDTLDRDGTVDFRGASGEVTFGANGDIRGPFFINVWTISGGAVTDLRIERIEATP